jgi:hypothetical protein
MDFLPTYIWTSNTERSYETAAIIGEKQSICRRLSVFYTSTVLIEMILKVTFDNDKDDDFVVVVDDDVIMVMLMIIIIIIIIIDDNGDDDDDNIYDDNSHCLFYCCYLARECQLGQNRIVPEYSFLGKYVILSLFSNVNIT